MEKVYSSPLKVYLILGLLAITGVWCGTQLPISLFPNSSKPEIIVQIPYSGQTPDEFLQLYGADFESELKSITSKEAELKRVLSEYKSDRVYFFVQFEWGSDPMEAEKEVKTVANAFGARLPEDSRRGLWVWNDNENSGFFAASFYSETRSLDELYDQIEPALGPKLAGVLDAEMALLWNPSSKEIRFILDPDTMASLQLLPKDIERVITPMLGSYSGGTVSLGQQILPIELRRQAVEVSDLGNLPVSSPGGQSVHLSDIGKIEYGPKMSDTRSFKTSGRSSLILFAKPKPGGNVKKMSEDIIRIVNEAKPSFTEDVKYRIIVDPSEFIRASVNNVLFEVFLAAFIAVGILFLFIGSVRNVITAAIEIPLSMVLAFILMRLFDMNLNLVSLGGLALSAGMNVDASVVVMENILRHFGLNPDVKSYKDRLALIVKAVNEVRLPVIAATISSLVVFIPLTFTSNLTYAILGDLAKAVVFSHGFSAFVALILVPTIRLQLLTQGEKKTVVSPFEGKIKKLENFYATLLNRFLNSPKLKLGIYGGLVATLALLLLLLLPHLPREIIGKPDTDWIYMSVKTKGNTLIKQMELQAQEVERVLLDKFGDKIQYTFNQIRRPNKAGIMARLKNKRDMKMVWREMEDLFTNTPELRYHVRPWNPSELPVPDPHHLRVKVTAKEDAVRAEIAREVKTLMNEHDVYTQGAWARPSVDIEQSVFLEPHMEQWAVLNKGSRPISPADLSDLVLVATKGRRLGEIPVNGRRTAIHIQFPMGLITNAEDVAAIPIGINSKIIPLKALATVKIAQAPPGIFREDGRDAFFVYARNKVGEEDKIEASQLRAKQLIDKWLKEEGAAFAGSVEITDPFYELSDALKQLAFAVGLSILFIFITLLFQFGSLSSTLIVMVSVPLGFIGVMVSLFVFQSTVSLNSALGVILLNGIAVANSIILVDFMHRLLKDGRSPKEAALEAARKRMRPILITSLTTILGMLPIALGMGDGGKVLQPLGITVSGGLWVSTLLTLFLVPSLMVSYLEWQASENNWVKRLSWRKNAEAIPEPIS